MRKKAVPVLGVSELRWKGKDEIGNSHNTVFYNGSGSVEIGVAIFCIKTQ
jgi:hypothetical protein